MSPNYYPRPAQLHPFVEVCGERHRAISTPGDLPFHVRAVIGATTIDPKLLTAAERLQYEALSPPRGG